MFDWHHYLELAESLIAERPDDEAALRSALSRAYYSVFGAARGVLDPSDSLIVKSGRAHDQVWSMFGESQRGVRQRISQEGRRLKRRREKADYDRQYDNLAHDAPQWVAQARRMIQDIDHLNQDAHE